MRALGVITGLAAFALAGLAAWTMHRAKTAIEPWKPSTNLVTTGIFGRTRNPIYVGLLLLLAGFGLWFGSPGIALMWLVAASVLHVGVVRREERYLQTIFGQEFRDYTARVRRWL
ncbi:isoprenylcysteine carboxylmethyltransferase family protein [Paracoccus sp. TK19116]|uniref:Isoprenylcysteine carboxylmethyltransferase family protein n=1 Tax=Paracoccus albicereus TaxID=2922394 RepID=A0ABT1MU01_9RHOB|nr:isoprenylcysteine carboxylmethyltransferase family protein [Paracoccus albicereus]MCQ0971819.1 isoprenylcysteine carboxylmethyltransferase family protein [Paracoccus albicereus]